MWASMKGHEDCLQLLIAAGANIEQKSDVRELKEWKGLAGG